eukprot:EG_transcript_22654
MEPGNRPVISEAIFCHGFAPNVSPGFEMHHGIDLEVVDFSEYAQKQGLVFDIKGVLCDIQAHIQAHVLVNHCFPILPLAPPRSIFLKVVIFGFSAKALKYPWGLKMTLLILPTAFDASPPTGNSLWFDLMPIGACRWDTSHVNAPQALLCFGQRVGGGE